jgi:hypothetical protein
MIPNPLVPEENIPHPRDIVICRSSSEYAETPKELYWEGKWLNIKEIVIQSRTTEGKFFIVKAPNESLFTLIYNQITDQWLVQLK